jgi:hypothetical protein
MTELTLKTFRELTANLHEDTPIYYHAYDKGCCLGSYSAEDLWLFPKGGTETRGVVINPGACYDHRRPASANSANETLEPDPARG